MSQIIYVNAILLTGGHIPYILEVEDEKGWAEKKKAKSLLESLVFVSDSDFSETFEVITDEANLCHELAGLVYKYQISYSALHISLI